MPRGASWWAVYRAWREGRRYEREMNEAAARARAKARLQLQIREEERRRGLDREA